MLGSWIIYVGVGLVGSGLLGLVSTKRGRRWLGRQRGKLRRKAVRDTKDAWHANRKAKAATPRGKLQAKRRRQPKRLTFGHRRTPDDPHPARIAARKTKAGTAHLVEKAKVARANRKAQRTPKRPLELLRGKIAYERESWNQTYIPPDRRELKERARSEGRCGSTQTDSGRPCRNRRVIGDRWCHKHGGRSAA